MSRAASCSTWASRRSCPVPRSTSSRPKDLRIYEGKTLECKIVKLNEERKNVVLSRRELIEAERAEKRSKLLSGIEKGSTVKGTVKNITDFGAFIDLDGLDGLLHITDMSWSRLNHPSELLKVGQEIEVLVLDIDREKERVSLGLKQKTDNPWDKIAEKYPVNLKVKGKVTNLVPYGAFVELEPGIEGLVHVSELSWTKRIARPADVLTQGQELRRLSSASARKTRRSRSACASSTPTRGKSSPQSTRLAPASRARSATSPLTAHSWSWEEGIDGMIHVSDLSWTRKINHPSEMLKKGDDIEAEVLDIDKANQRISLSLKHLADDPWKSIEDRYKIGDLVTGKVSKVASFGAFVQLADEIDGLVHISQISNDRVEKVKEVLKIGQEVSAPRHQGGQDGAPHRPLHQGRRLHARAARAREGKLRSPQARRRARLDGSRLRPRRRGLPSRRRQEEVRVAVALRATDALEKRAWPKAARAFSLCGSPRPPGARRIDRRNTG